MNIDSIDEVESLIRKYRKVMAAKSKIETISGEDGGDAEEFTLIDKDSQVEICLHNLKTEALEGIESVLNDQHDKIVARLREI